MYDVALVLAVLVFLAITVWYVRSGYCNIYHPFTLYLAFHGFLFVFRPILARVMDFRFIYRLYEFTPTDADKTRAILVATLGLVSFAFFCFRRGDVAMRFHGDGTGAIGREALIPPFLAAAAICFPIGLYSLLTSWSDAGSDVLIASMVRDKATHILVNTSNNGYFTDAQTMLVPCTAGLAWLFRFRLIALVPFVAFFVIRAGIGSRGAFVAAAVATALLWLYDRRRTFPASNIVLGAVLIVAIFNAVGQDRGRAIRQWFGPETTAAPTGGGDNGLRPLEGMDFGNLEYLEYLVYTIPQRTHTYSLFTDQLQLFTEPVPRVLWPGKPVGPPIQLFNLFDYGNPIGMTNSLPGMGWAGAGWIGVVFWCGGWGYVLGWIYRKFATGPQTAFQLMAYMIFLSSLIVGFRDGGLVTIGRQNLFFMLPILLWIFFARRLGVTAAAGRHPPGAGDRRPAAAAHGSALPPAVARRRAALAAMRLQTLPPG